MFGFDDIVSVLTILNSIASMAKTAQSFAQPTPAGQKQDALPTPTSTDMSQQARTALPGQKADAASRLGGGISPEFLASLLGEQVGDQSAGLNVLGDIRRSLNVGQA